MLLNIASNKSESSLSVVDAVSVQPNAVDLRLARVFKFRDSVKGFINVFEIDEDDKTHAQKEEILPNDDGYWYLYPSTYEIQFEGLVSMGEKEAGWVITRSTLNRNGVFITTGLYDSGYNGAAAAALHVMSVPMKIKKGTRVAQFVLAESEAVKSYDGSYGISTETGAPKKDEAVYHGEKNG